MNGNVAKSIMLEGCYFMKKPTIHDVAKEAEVTKSTVSRVLNNSPLVTEKTRTRILEAIDRLGYVPNKVARSLKSGKSNIIGFVITEQDFSEVILNPTNALMLKAVTERAQSHGYNILIITPAGVNYQSYIDLITNKTADGFILIGAINDTLSKRLDKEKIPYVFNTKYSNEHDNNQVKFNQVESGYIATKYLLDLGHKDIKLIVGDVKGNILTHNEERIEGFKKALDKYGLRMTESMVLKTPGNVEGSYNFIKNLYKEEHPTGLLLSNEVTAITALNCLLNEGYKIPEDLSIVAFGHSDTLKSTHPSLTTVHHDYEWQGKNLVDMLLTRINNYEATPRAIVKQPELIIGRSTANPRFLHSNE
jgi:LacI family transcriptional regulator